MAFPCYLAMTAAEILRCEKIPPEPAYLSCHFSPYGKGLSAIPPSLPPDTLLILTDRTPICGHEADLVARQLCDAAARLKCCGILLDLQRPDSPEAPAIVKAVLETASCPVAVSQLYAAEGDYPVLVSPSPLWTDPEELLAPWKGRPVWLETVPEGALVTVTAEGSAWEPIPWNSFTPKFHHDGMHADYRIEKEKDRVKIYLRRDSACLDSLAEYAKTVGAVARIGLYQQI